MQKCTTSSVASNMTPIAVTTLLPESHDVNTLCRWNPRSARMISRHTHNSQLGGMSSWPLALVAIASFFVAGLVGSGSVAAEAMGEVSSSTDSHMHVGWTDERNMTVCPLTHACIDPSAAADRCRVCTRHKAHDADAAVGRQGGKNRYLHSFTYYICGETEQMGSFSSQLICCPASCRPV